MVRPYTPSFHKTAQEYTNVSYLLKIAETSQYFALVTHNRRDTQNSFGFRCLLIQDSHKYSGTNNMHFPQFIAP